MHTLRWPAVPPKTRTRTTGDQKIGRIAIDVSGSVEFHTVNMPIFDSSVKHLALRHLNTLSRRTCQHRKVGTIVPF
jgi:hypothetical protein